VRLGRAVEKEHRERGRLGMIVTKRQEGLHLVKQYDHGTLAGDFTRHWGNERFDRPEPFESCRLASSMHDEGWRTYDDEPAMNRSEERPAHFLEVPLAESVVFYKAGIDKIYTLDEYAGLMAGMHWTGLYRGRWGVQGSPAAPGEPLSELDRLKDETVVQEETRWISVKHRTLAASDIRSEFETRLWHNYELLQAWDFLSLFVCLTPLTKTGSGADPVPVGQTLASVSQSPGPRLVPRVPFGAGRGRTDLVLLVVDEGVVRVDPWPFRERSFSISVPLAVIPDRRYSSLDDVAAALGSARPHSITCEFRA
jgi:hypothetical protein